MAAATADSFAGTAESLGSGAVARAAARAGARAAVAAPGAVAAAGVAVAAGGIWGSLIHAGLNDPYLNPGGINAPPSVVYAPLPITPPIAVSMAQRPGWTFPPNGQGPPNGSLAEDRGKGKGTIRIYGPKGENKTDYDFGDTRGGKTDPHAHDFDPITGERSPWRPLCPGE